MNLFPLIFKGFRINLGARGPAVLLPAQQKYFISKGLFSIYKKDTSGLLIWAPRSDQPLKVSGCVPKCCAAIACIRECFLVQHFA